jgi:hypothetical protein
VFLGPSERVTFCRASIGMRRFAAQIPARGRYLRTVIDTAWLYPRSNIDAALAATSQPVTYDGGETIVGSVAALTAVAGEIWANTEAEFPDQGFNIGVGSLLEDLGQKLTFCLPNGLVFLEWRRVRLLTDQTSLPVGGAAPVGTEGFLPVFVAPGNIVGAAFDPVRVVRTG